jgi:cleavage stimulation factor subunit 3
MASDGADNTDAHLNGNASWADNGWSGNAETSGSTMESGDQEDEYSIPQTGPTSDGSEDAADIDEDSAEYDPESVEITTTAYNPESVITTPTLPVNEERSNSTTITTSRPVKKPGFIMGSSDDEDDAPTPPSNPPKPAPSNMQPRAYTQSPLQQTTVSQEATTLHPSHAGNGTVAAADHPAIGGTNTKLRLPTDVVGMLEDRIKEDPKGDIEAWFTLIEEQKRRHKIEDTRNTYERFLEIFPQTVRDDTSFILRPATLTTSRLKFGSRIWKWS